MTNENHVLQSFQLATERYASLGVDTTQVLEKMNKISLSLHQGAAARGLAANPQARYWQFGCGSSGRLS